MKGYIYKITCLVNNKIYIGLTTTSIEQRWKGHINASKKSQKHLYASMRKYGIKNFKIEQIDETDDFEKLGELERFYIKKYNSTNPEFGYNNTFGGEKCQLDGNPRARLTVSDVENIRKYYQLKTLTISEVWEKYKDKISFSAFEKIWLGNTWRSIMPEVYTLENRVWHKRNNSSTNNVGEKNPNSIYTDEEVTEIRKFYVNHSLEECFKTFGSKSKSKVSFRHIIDGGYKHLPIYKKKIKKWVQPKLGENDITRNLKRNVFKIKGDLLYIKVYSDFTNESKTFFTNSKFYDIISNKTWHFYSNSISTFINDAVLPIKNLIINNNKYEKIYNIDGNVFNLTEENLTKDKCDVVFRNVDKIVFFNDYKKLSMRKMIKKYHTTAKNIKDFYEKYKK